MTRVTEIRDFAETDWPAVIELIDAYDVRQTDGLTHRDRESRWEAAAPRFRVVAEDSGGVCGYGKTGRRCDDIPGRFVVKLYVHPRTAGQGIGRGIYSQLERFASETGAEFLISAAMDTCPRGMKFAEQSGYQAVQHLFESVLDVRTFEVSPYESVRIELGRAGYRFSSLAEVGDTDENRRRLHALDAVTDVDTPGIENWGPRSYEQYVSDEFESHGFSAEAIRIATFGEEWVGLNSIRESRNEGVFEVDYTGVHPDHRGRGVAQALKLEGILYARSVGAHEIRTYNDDRNGPMIAINKKLGFVPEPGFTTMRKDLEV